MTDPEEPEPVSVALTADDAEPDPALLEALHDREDPVEDEGEEEDGD